MAGVIEIAGTRRFLPHDKDRRWSDHKDEQVITSAIVREPGLVWGLGIGRNLWRAEVLWGQHHQAAYQLLQTEVGGASDMLCRSEGLTDLGLARTSTL